MGLTWNPRWINPFESAWSIIEKIKYANAITSLEFVREFGKRDLNGRLINQRNGLLRFYGINDLYLTQSTGIALNKQTDHHLNKMIGMFKQRYAKSLIRKELTFCEECLSMGYHSILHQFIFIHKCPYHLVNLKNECMSCGNSTSCHSHNYNSTGFQCGCSNSYTLLKFNSLSEWQLNLTLIDNVVSDWVTMDLTTFNRISDTYFYLPSLITMNEPLQFLLDFGRNSR